MGGNQKSQNKRSNFTHEPHHALSMSGHKVIDQTNGTTFGSTGTVTQIAFPGQGIAYNQRIADRLKLARIDFSFNLYGNSGNSVDSVRCIVLQEIGLTAGAPTPSQVLQSVATQSPLLYNVEKLYHILWDQRYSLSSNGDSQSRAINVHINPVVKDIQFQTGSTTAYSGQLFVLWLSAASTTNTCIANTYWRQWFVDND
jgi:hypothetical protein